MSLLIWILIYIVEMAFWLWIALWGGAERLDGTWLVRLFVNWRAADWDPESVKLVAWYFMFATTFYFFLGLFEPRLRFNFYGQRDWFY